MTAERNGITEISMLAHVNLWMLNFKTCFQQKMAFFVKGVASLGGREKWVQQAESIPWSSRPPG